MFFCDCLYAFFKPIVSKVYQRNISQFRRNIFDKHTDITTFFMCLDIRNFVSFLYQELFTLFHRCTMIYELLYMHIILTEEQKFFDEIHLRTLRNPRDIFEQLMWKNTSNVSHIYLWLLQRLLQYLTCSQVFSHFFLQEKDRSQVGQILVGRSCFFFCFMMIFYGHVYERYASSLTELGHFFDVTISCLALFLQMIQGQL